MFSAWRFSLLGFGLGLYVFFLLIMYSTVYTVHCKVQFRMFWPLTLVQQVARLWRRTRGSMFWSSIPRGEAPTVEYSILYSCSLFLMLLIYFSFQGINYLQVNSFTASKVSPWVSLTLSQSRPESVSPWVSLTLSQSHPESVSPWVSLTMSQSHPESVSP